MSRCPNGTRRNKLTGKCETSGASVPKSSKSSSVLYVLHGIEHPYHCDGIFSSYDKAMDVNIEKTKFFAHGRSTKYNANNLKEQAIVCTPYLNPDKPIYAIINKWRKCPFDNKQHPEMIHPNYYLTHDKKVLKTSLKEMANIDISNEECNAYILKIDEY
jgi:hypothetical protein